MTGPPRVEVSEDIEEIGAAHWPALPDPDSLYLTYAWLRSVEGVLSPRRAYLTLRQGSRPLAALPCSLIEDPATYGYFNPRHRLLDPELCGGLERLLGPGGGPRLTDLAQEIERRGDYRCPALLAVAPYGYVCGVAWAEDVAAGERPGLLAPLLAAFGELAEHLGARTPALWYVHAGVTPDLEDQARAAGYRPVTLGAECRLEVRWPTFEAYLEALPARRRRAARHEIRRFQRSGLQVSVEGPEALGEELAALQVAARRRHGHGSSLERAHLGYRRATEHLGEAIRVFVARRAGQAAGFLVAYEHGDSLYCKQVGFDRDVGDFVYFNVTFYAPIRFAVERGLRFVQYGMESYEAKLRRGCELVPVLGYVRPRDEVASRHLDLYDRAQRAAAASLVERYGRDLTSRP